MEPLILIPPIKDYIWGGTKLRTDFGKISDLPRLAESWELSCHKDGQSIIADGEFKGKTLSEYLSANPDALGTSCKHFEYFPVLIKLIDACDNLSVQVHPDNDYAKRVEGEYGKTEMWYIVDCDENAELIYGFKEKISKDDFRNAIHNNALLDKVNRVRVKKGDVFFIKSGTLHAIGKGILIAEIQQNSNTTYRVYDYGRLGTDGKPRQLHIEKAIDVTELKPAQQQANFPSLTLEGKSKGTVVRILADCEYFTASLATLDNSSYFANVSKRSFLHALVIDGCTELSCCNKTLTLKKGSSVFIPASAGEASFNGKCSIIFTDINTI